MKCIFFFYNIAFIQNIFLSFSFLKKKSNQLGYLFRRWQFTCESQAFNHFHGLEQWFPTTVPRNISVPQAGPKCSAKFFETLKFRIYGFKCSVRGFFGLKCSARTLPGLKCSTNQKRLGTTGLEPQWLVNPDIYYFIETCPDLFRSVEPKKLRRESFCLGLGWKQSWPIF
jgi:hypothetical protein